MRSKLFAGVVAVAALAAPGLALAQSGGNGQAQESQQFAQSLQAALSQANAFQNAVNGNAPVNKGGKNVTTGNNAANQTPKQRSESEAENEANTDQDAPQVQKVGSSSCTMGCGGNGQAQQSNQFAETLQAALSQAEANQNAVNGNAPVNIAGGNIMGGNNEANQTATNEAESEAENEASTNQNNEQTQEIGKSSCMTGCGGNGQAQESQQTALTGQAAISEAQANQNAVNANVPVNVAGGNVTTGNNAANQTSTNSAESSAENEANTNQNNQQTQSIGSSSCKTGCGGNGQSQESQQTAHTGQLAESQAEANQNTVNANVPVNIAGGSITTGNNEANQTATNTGNSSATNNSNTNQSNEQTQTA
jgi:hypothetical protein